MRKNLWKKCCDKVEVNLKNYKIKKKRLGNSKYTDSKKTGRKKLCKFMPLE